MPRIRNNLFKSAGHLLLTIILIVLFLIVTSQLQSATQRALPELGICALLILVYVGLTVKIKAQTRLFAALSRLSLFLSLALLYPDPVFHSLLLALFYISELLPLGGPPAHSRADLLITLGLVKTPAKKENVRTPVLVFLAGSVLAVCLAMGLSIDFASAQPYFEKLPLLALGLWLADSLTDSDSRRQPQIFEQKRGVS